MTHVAVLAAVIVVVAVVIPSLCFAVVSACSIHGLLLALAVTVPLVLAHSTVCGLHNRKASCMLRWFLLCCKRCRVVAEPSTVLVAGYVFAVLVDDDPGLQLTSSE